MFFIRTHWAWECRWEEWNPGHYAHRDGGWTHRSTHFGDYDTAFDKCHQLSQLPPGMVRNIAINRRPVGAPRRFLRRT